MALVGLGIVVLRVTVGGVLSQVQLALALSISKLPFRSFIPEPLAFRVNTYTPSSSVKVVKFKVYSFAVL